MGVSPTLLAPIWAVLLAGVIGSLPPPAEDGRCSSAFNYFQARFGVCCQKCQPGYFAQTLCTKFSNTVCQPCPAGEFTEFWNYVRECHLCPRCDPRRNLEVTDECSASRKTRCRCRRGYHCLGGLDCSDCEPHSLCVPGQEMVKSGTFSEDTQCEKCSAGTFKAELSLGKCRNHTDCRAQGLVTVHPGTPVSDAVCGSSPSVPLFNSPREVNPTKAVESSTDGPGFLIAVFTVSALVFCALLVVFVLQFRRCRSDRGTQDKTQTPADNDQTSLESDEPLLGGVSGGPASPRQTEDLLGLPGIQGQAHGLLGVQGSHVNSLSSNLTVHGPLYIYNGPAPNSPTQASPASPPASPPAGSDCAPARQPGAPGETVRVSEAAAPEQETGRGLVLEWGTARTGPPVVGTFEAQQEVGRGGGSLCQ